MIAGIDSRTFQSVVDVHASANATTFGKAAHDVLQASDELSRRVADLQALADSFVAKLRTAA